MENEKQEVLGYNPDIVTLEDCLDNYELKGEEVVLNDGKVVEFIK